MTDGTRSFCGKCGSERLAQDDRYCRSCGNVFDAVNAPLPPALPASPEIPIVRVPRCTNCGAERVGRTPYCAKCGTKWPDGAPRGVAAHGQPAVPAQRSDAKALWWKSQPAVIAGMILFFPIGLILMWLYAPWRTRTKWIWSAVFAVLLSLFVIGGIVGDEESTKNEAATNAAPTRIPEAAATDPAVPPTPAPLPTVKPPSWKEGGAVTYTAAIKALSDGDEMIRSLNLGEPRGVQIDGESITVTYKGKSALKETDLLTIAAQTSFSAHRAIFANPRVVSVTVIILADWTDQFGAESEDVTTVSTLDRLTVVRIDWDGLEDRVILDNKHMFCISDSYRIHGGIYSRLGNTGCLTGATRF